ncbi:hypothetical protein AB2523_25255 [Klebsiella michiganensis]
MKYSSLMWGQFQAIPRKHFQLHAKPTFMGSKSDLICEKQCYKSPSLIIIFYVLFLILRGLFSHFSWRATGVMGGMLTATLLAIFFVPVFFVVVRRRFTKHAE